MTDPGRTLGNELRGAELGFRWLDTHAGGRYVRLSAYREALWRLDVATGYAIPSKVRGDHYCWWDLDWIAKQLEPIVARFVELGHDGYLGVLLNDNGMAIDSP